MSDSKTAIVTGAGSGIGRAVALTLARHGYRLTLVGRTRSKLEDAAALLDHRTPLIVPADVSAPDACANVVGQTIERFRRLDALVNAAGYASLVPVEQITNDQWRKTIDTNLSSVVLLTAAAWPHLRQRGGVIVNLSSMSSVDPFPGLWMYGAAKAGVNMFTHGTAAEGEPLGIKALAVAPGAVETPMLRGLFDQTMVPPANTLSPQDVAEVICDCILGKRAFKSGQTILLPGP